MGDTKDGREKKGEQKRKQQERAEIERQLNEADADEEFDLESGADDSSTPREDADEPVVH